MACRKVFYRLSEYSIKCSRTFLEGVLASSQMFSGTKAKKAHHRQSVYLRRSSTQTRRATQMRCAAGFTARRTQTRSITTTYEREEVDEQRSVLAESVERATAEILEEFEQRVLLVLLAAHDEGHLGREHERGYKVGNAID